MINPHYKQFKFISVVTGTTERTLPFNITTTGNGFELINKLNLCILSVITMKYVLK